MGAVEDRDRFYAILAELENRLGKRRLCDSHKKMGWPPNGIYFFFEDGEVRAKNGECRVVRVGINTADAKPTQSALWRRLGNHKRGNRDNSVFCRHVYTALTARGDCTETDKADQIKKKISKHIGAMRFQWIAVNDCQKRDCIERNCIALLSCISTCGKTADASSKSWLGTYCKNPKVQCSGLWNVKHTDDHEYDPDFLDELAKLAKQTKTPARDE